MLLIELLSFYESHNLPAEEADALKEQKYVEA